MLISYRARCMWFPAADRRSARGARFQRDGSGIRVWYSLPAADNPDELLVFRHLEITAFRDVKVLTASASGRKGRTSPPATGNRIHPFGAFEMIPDHRRFCRSGCIKALPALGVAAIGVMVAVGGDGEQAVALRQIIEQGVNPLFLFHAVIHHFDEEVIFSEDLDVFAGRPIGGGDIAGHEKAGIRPPRQAEEAMRPSLYFASTESSTRGL